MRKTFIASGITLLFAVSAVYLLKGPTSRIQTDVPYEKVQVDVTDGTASIERFAGTLRFKTVSERSAENHVKDPEEFRKLHQYLRRQWPSVFSKLHVEQVNELSLLLVWKGSDPLALPILCISHQDVVAVGSESKWRYPPFSGAVKEGYVWGRGALDLKYTLAALLEAVSQLLTQGHIPQRTIYFTFGHDEEVSGGFGAGAIATLLDERGIKFDHIIDEGGTILTDGFKPLTRVPIGVVGTAEKATINIEVEMHGTGGHTMTPPQDGSSVVARMARFVQAVETKLSTPKLHHPTSDLLKSIGSVAESSLLRPLLQNCDLWPISWLLAQVLTRKDPGLAAVTRTTGITTDIQFLPPGRNVIPSVAIAHLSFRILPNDKVERIQEQLQSMADAEAKHGEVKISMLDQVEQSPISSAGSWGFKLIERAALEVLKGPEGLVMSPYLMPGRTDSTHYIRLSGGNIFRFAPFTTNRTGGDVQRVHGIDERVGTESYLNGVRFFMRYLQLASEVEQSIA